MFFPRFLLPVVSLAFVFLPLAAQRPARTPAHHRAARSASTQNQFKGIFEPVNYEKDITLTDVVFVTPEVGWVSGEHSSILKTTNGGTTWTPQLGGDPGSNEPAIGQLRFLDATHGWAIQGGSRLLRTADGQKWEEVNGKFPAGVPVLDYAFTSQNHGILLGGNGDAFYVTNDGGRQWQTVTPCQVNATVQGLAQTQDCHLIKLQMLSPTSGLALAWWSSTKDERLAVFRTDDAGEHWSFVVPDVQDSRYADAFFTDLKHGVLLFNNDQKTCVTEDGGKSWHTLVSGNVALKGPLRFADREVGWVLGPSPDNSDTVRVSFSTDGGEHWKMSRNIAFPTGRADLKFAFPRRDRAYVIGPHGMIYRYRIVPATYKAAHMLEGPLMPASSTIHAQR